jgi:hypothetical protein
VVDRCLFAHMPRLHPFRKTIFRAERARKW